MLKIVSFLFLFIGYSYASLIGSNFNQRDLQVLEDLDIKSSFITDYKLQKTYNYLLSNHNKKNYVRKLSNASLFVPKIKEILRNEGIPSTFLYMAMAESNFTMDARSSVRATGLWQFMSATGRTYGLKNNLYVDERMDLVKSTKAATKYLKYLHKRFGKWYLAAIAYNCGEGRVIEAITRSTLDMYVEQNPKAKKDPKIKAYRQVIFDYQRKKVKFYKLRRVYNEVKKWDMKPDINKLLIVQNKVSRQYLPSESRQYIRKIISLGMMNNQSFIVQDDNSHLMNMGATSSVATVSAKGGLHLKSIAKITGMKYKELVNLNKHLKENIIPPFEKNYDIYIPYSRLSRYNANKDQIKDSKLLVYRVQRGDSLGRIGKKYGISYKIIKDFNNLKSNFLSLKQKLIIPVATKERKSKEIMKRAMNFRNVDKKILFYKVKNGDTLYSIARNHKVKLKKLMTDNKLNSNFISIGDKIVIKR